MKLENAHWRHVGKLDVTGTKERLSALLAAQFSGKRVMIAYPDGYDCNQGDFSTSAVIIRTYNN